MKDTITNEPTFFHKFIPRNGKWGKEVILNVQPAYNASNDVVGDDYFDLAITNG